MKTRKILVVDDEPLLRITIQRILLQLGYSVAVAQNGAEALNCFSDDEIGLVVTDYEMPGMQGDELAEAIKQRCPTVPVMLWSGNPPETRPKDVDYMMQKPCSLEEFLQPVREFMKLPVPV